MTARRNTVTKAFGVEAGHAPYRLRQARYAEIGADCARWASCHFAATGQHLDLLDIGTWDGVIRMYTEVHPGAETINYHAVDIFPMGEDFVYKSASWTFHHIDLEQGLPGLEPERYNTVICEQVLEHLHNPRLALADMYRVLRPGGKLLLGVPIFPPGLHLARKHVVPVMDRLFRVKKNRSHVQGWSRGSFLQLVRQTCPDLIIERTRGFRIISGGILRPLEYCRWWWQLNRHVGRLVPALCIEIQIIAHKPKTPVVTRDVANRAA